MLKSRDDRKYRGHSFVLRRYTDGVGAVWIWTLDYGQWTRSLPMANGNTRGEEVVIAGVDRQLEKCVFSVT